MTQYTPAQARDLADGLENSTGEKLWDDSAAALRSLADQLEQANLQRIAEPGQQQFALDALIAAGFVTQAKVDEALELAKPHSAAAPVVPAPVASPWLPIDGAPKDGTEMLLLAPFGDVGVCYWRADEQMTGWTWGLGKAFNNPSHYMPLPPAPGAQAAPVVQQTPPAAVEGTK